MLQHVHFVLIFFVEVSTWSQTDRGRRVHNLEILTLLAPVHAWSYDDFLHIAKPWCLQIPEILYLLGHKEWWLSHHRARKQVRRAWVLVLHCLSVHVVLHKEPRICHTYTPAIPLYQDLCSYVTAINPVASAQHSMQQEPGRDKISMGKAPAV